MQIPIKVDYGVRALVDLAKNANRGPIRAADIANRASIPEPFLAQVLHALNKRGLIRSQRGPQGGHLLAMDPADIPLSLVMACLGHQQTVVGCLDESKSCIHTPDCVQREVWQTVDEAIYKILDSTTIAYLMKRSLALEDSNSSSNGEKLQRKSPVGAD